MNRVLTVEMLETIGVRHAILTVGRYSLPVQLRVHEETVDCRVPTWSGVGDLLEPSSEATLVACIGELCRQWLFIRGPVTLLPAPDWDGLQPLPGRGLESADLYQILRVDPRRIELVDELRGWGYRETVDR